MGLVASTEEEKRCRVPHLAHSPGPAAQAPVRGAQERQEGKGVVEEVAGARRGREVRGVAGQGAPCCSATLLPSHLLLPPGEHPHIPASGARLPRHCLAAQRSLLPTLFVFCLTSLSTS